MENILVKKFLEQYIVMIEWVNLYINALTDKDFEMELSPGKNHGVWILGHMIASDDDFSLMMGKGELLFPEYQELFGQGSKLQPVKNYPAVEQLRKQWNDLFEKNKKIYEDLKDADFNQPPENTTDANKDFFNTKAKVIMAWQLHQMYHGGQLSVLAVRSGKKMF
ncbi:MAG: DinB family protein [Ignavibacteria bacterium]